MYLLAHEVKLPLYKIGYLGAVIGENIFYFLLKLWGYNLVKVKEKYPVVLCLLYGKIPLVAKVHELLLHELYVQLPGNLFGSIGTVRVNYNNFVGKRKALHITPDVIFFIVCYGEGRYFWRR